MGWTQTLMASVAIGALGLVLTFPVEQVDTAPPVCYSLFGYQVPCGFTFSTALAGTLALVGGVVAAFYARGRTGR
jgi:hypothetical protein